MRQTIFLMLVFLCFVESYVLRTIKFFQSQHEFSLKQAGAKARRSNSCSYLKLRLSFTAEYQVTH